MALKKKRLGIHLFIKIMRFLLIATIPSIGAYLKNVPQALRQPDGTILHCLASGDEFHNWLHDKEGFTIIQDPTSGFFVYATKMNDKLYPTRHVVGKVDPHTISVEQGLNRVRQRIQERRQSRVATLRLRETYRAPTHGTLNNIVIFIRFNDQGEFTEQLSLYEGQLNTDANSMKAYYYEASYQALTIQSHFYPESFNGQIVSYQDAHPRNYYQPYNFVTNPDGYRDDDESRNREHTLLKNAVNGVAHQIPANLDLDLDNDGLVDNVCFIVQGEADGWNDCLWPHMWVLWSFDPQHGDGSGNAIINGSTVWTYNFNLSKFSSSGPGVFCHEMFHSLGAPDLYHYTDNDISPVGPWDLMDDDQNPPQHMGSYMKYRYGGWIADIPEINSEKVYTLNPLTSAMGNCFKMTSPNSSTEYFVLEYRKKEGTFESSLPGSGLLVYRINMNADGEGNANGPPDEVYIYRPGGTPTQDGDISHAHFSSDFGRIQISDHTDPFPFLSDGSSGGLTISNIGSAGSTIQFTLGGIYPSMTTEGESFSQTLGFNETASQILSVTNTGDQGSILTYSLSFQSPPPGANLSKTLDMGGSTFQCAPDLYQPRTTFDLLLTITNNSPDDEWFDGATLQFPSGITVNSSTHFEGGSRGKLRTNHNTGEGVTVSWSDLDGGFGNILPGESATATVNISTTSDIKGDVNLEWTLSGDDYGSTPHTLSGNITLKHSWLIPEPNSGQCIYGETDDISLNFNATALIPGDYDGTIIIIHNSGDPIQIPVHLTVTDPSVASTPPALLSLQPVNTTNLRLTFSHVESADTYNVYRSTTAFFTPDIINGTNRVASGITDEDPITAGVQWTDHDHVIGDPSVNYFYVITAVAKSESEPSERFGEFDYPLTTTPTTDFNEIALPLITSEINDAQHLLEAIDGCNSTARWNADIQGYDQYISGIPQTNFSVEMGYPYYVNLTKQTVFTLLGKIADPSFDLITTTTTDFNEIMLPLDRTDIVNASQLMNDISTCNSVAYWDASVQGYQQYIPGIPQTDFVVRVGYPYYVNVTADVTWPQGGTSKRSYSSTSHFQTKEMNRVPHCAWGRFDPNGKLYANIHFSAYIKSRPAEILTGQSPGCLLEDGYWVVQCGSFPSPWRAGDTLHVVFSGKDGRSFSEVDVQLTCEPADKGDLLFLDVSKLYPTRFALQQNIPNPFNHATTIFFTTPKTCHVKMTIYNTRGQEIRILVDETRTAGRHQVVWNGKDDKQRALESGLYLIKMQAEHFSDNLSVLLIQ